MSRKSPIVNDFSSTSMWKYSTYIFLPSRLVWSWQESGRYTQPGTHQPISVQGRRLRYRLVHFRRWGTGTQGFKVATNYLLILPSLRLVFVFAKRLCNVFRWADYFIFVIFTGSFLFKNRNNVRFHDVTFGAVWHDSRVSCIFVSQQGLRVLWGRGVILWA